MDGEKDSNYEISGTLLKKGNKGIKKLWKKRWLVLRKNGDALEYYASHLPGERLLGKIELQTITSVTTSKKKFSFRIHTTNRTYAFRGKNEQNVEYFISSINQVPFFFPLFPLYFLLIYFYLSGGKEQAQFKFFSKAQPKCGKHFRPRAH